MPIDDHAYIIILQIVNVCPWQSAMILIDFDHLCPGESFDLMLLQRKGRGDSKIIRIDPLEIMIILW